MAVMKTIIIGEAPSASKGAGNSAFPINTHSGARMHRLVEGRKVSLLNVLDHNPGKLKNSRADRRPSVPDGVAKLRGQLSDVTIHDQVGILLPSIRLWMPVIHWAAREGWAEPSGSTLLDGPINLLREGRVVGSALILPHPQGWPFKVPSGRARYKKRLLQWLESRPTYGGATPWQPSWVKRALTDIGL